MKELILKFNGKVISVRTNNDGLYCLNDIYRASGSSDSKRPSNFLRKFDRSILSAQTNKVRDGQTYVMYTTKSFVYRYAAFISDSFYNAVFDTFEAAASGNSSEAVNIATKVAIPQELIDKEADLRKKLNSLISEKFPDKKMQHSNFSRLISKAASGYTPKELTDGGVSSFKYMVENGHIPAVGSYIACLENAIMGLKAGLDYHVVAAMLNVETTKNKSLFK